MPPSSQIQGKKNVVLSDHGLIFLIIFTVKGKIKCLPKDYVVSDEVGKACPDRNVAQSEGMLILS